MYDRDVVGEMRWFDVGVVVGLVGWKVGLGAWVMWETVVTFGSMGDGWRLEGVVGFLGVGEDDLA